MDVHLAREARRLVERYLIEVVERFDLCPWAAPARARGEVSIDVVEPGDAAAALDRFAADERAAIGLVVMPDFAGGPAALRRRRDELLDGARGETLALADFHPDAALDAGDAARLVPFLRKSPFPMLQAVRHATLAGLRRAADALPARDQLAALAGRPVPRPRDPIAEVAAANLATFAAEREALEAALDDILRDRDATFSTSR